jgi:hypothetical protein
MTAPLATDALDACVTAPTVKPTAVSAVEAADCVSPTTLGTLTGAAEPPDLSSQAVTAAAIKMRRTALEVRPLIVIMFKMLSPVIRSCRARRSRVAMEIGCVLWRRAAQRVNVHDMNLL